VVALPAKTQLPALRRLAVSPWTLVLAATGAGGIVLRVWAYRSILGTPDADEGVVGLVGRHILDGQFPTFIWGLFYGGIQELLLTAPIFWIFGSSWLALRIVPIAITAATAVLIWRVGRRTIGEPAATVAGALFWIWPPYDVYQLTHQHGYYASDVFYCALFLLLALRVVEQPSTTRAGVFGLALGLGFWQTSHTVPVMVGAIAWTLWRRPQALRKLWAAVPLAVIGALPWLIWNAKHDWKSVNVSYDAHSTYWHRLRIFLSPLLPMIMGIRQYGSQARIIPAAPTYIVLVLLAGLFVYGAIRLRRRDASILYVVAIIFPFIYAISEFTIESSDPRYLVVFTPLLALLLAQLGTSRLRGAALLALGGIVSFVILHNAINQHGPEIDPPRDFRPLIATLDGLGVHYVYSSHWVAYRLAFETNERIIGVKNDWSHGVSWNGTQADPGPDAFIRYPPWERAVQEHRHAFVFYRDALPPLVVQLRHFGYRHVNVGTLVVYVLPPHGGHAAGA
jgi:4-amino-4-deoxy-L-arabinose transferase-like glycosyltransferase